MKQEKYFKQVIAFIMFFVIMVSTVGCSSSNEKKKVKEAEESKNFVYRGEAMPFSPQIEDIKSVFFGGDKLYIIADSQLFTSDLDGSNVQEIPLTFLQGSEETRIGNVVLTADSKLLVLLYTYSKTMYKTELITMDASGKEEWREDVTNLVRKGIIDGFVVGSDGNLYCYSQEEIVVADAKGNKLFDIPIDNKTVSGIAVTKDGTVVAGISEKGNASAREIDTKKKELGTSYELELNYFNRSDALMSGAKYDFYYSSDSHFYGYDMEEKQSIKLIDYVESCISQPARSIMIPLKDGSILVTTYDSANKMAVQAYKKVDPSQMNEKIIITYAGYWIRDDAKDIIMDFNASNDQYRVEMIDYSEDENALEKMTAEIIAGNGPDIFDMRHMPINQYVAMGLLEDLTPYMEQDAELDKNDFLENLYDAMCVDGKLYFLSQNFGIETYVGRVSDVGDTSGWTFDEMVEILNKKGNDVKLFENIETKDMILENFMGSVINDFVNWERGECKFDSEDFIQVLEFCNQYGEREFYEDAESILWASSSHYILNRLDTIQVHKAFLNNDNIHYIGYPNANGGGSYLEMDGNYGISSKSKHKDVAWEVIRTFMTKEYQGGYDMLRRGFGFPTRKDAMETYIKWCTTTTESYTNEFGEELPSILGFRQTFQNDATTVIVEIRPCSEEEVKLFMDLLGRTRVRYDANPVIQDICLEEAKSCFEGQRSAKEAADIIQNRVTTYVNEQRK